MISTLVNDDVLSIIFSFVFDNICELVMSLSVRRTL